MNVSSDTLFNGRLHCRQHRDGYRFSVDSLLLARFCTPASGDMILDLGAGCGIIGLLLYYRHGGLGIRIVGLELQPRLAQLAHENIRKNGFQTGMSIVVADLRKMVTSMRVESMDKVVCNPPYRKIGSGRINPASEQALARHELCAKLDDVIGAAAHVLKNRGRFFVVYPATRSATLLHALKQRSLEPKRIQPVYSYPQSGSARLVLVEAMKNGGEGVEILPPFHIFDSRNGSYSREIHEL